MGGRGGPSAALIVDYSGGSTPWNTVTVTRPRREPREHVLFALPRFQT